MRTFSLIICADLVCRVESEHGRRLRKRREEWRKKVFLLLLACHVAIYADNVNSCTHEHTRCVCCDVESNAHGHTGQRWAAKRRQRRRFQRFAVERGRHQRRPTRMYISDKSPLNRERARARTTPRASYIHNLTGCLYQT